MSKRFFLISVLLYVISGNLCADHTFLYNGRGFECHFKMFVGLNTTVYFDENELVSASVLTAADDISVLKTKNRVELSARNKDLEVVLTVWGASGRSYKLYITPALSREEHCNNVWVKLNKILEKKFVTVSKEIDYVELTQIMITHMDEVKANGFGKPVEGVMSRIVRTEQNKPIVFKSTVWPGFLLVQKKQFETARFVGHVYEVFNTLEHENYLDVRKIASKGIELVTPSQNYHAPRGEPDSKSLLYVVTSELVKDQYFGIRNGDFKEDKELEKNEKSTEKASRRENSADNSDNIASEKENSATIEVQ